MDDSRNVWVGLVALIAFSGCASRFEAPDLPPEAVEKAIRERMAAAGPDEERDEDGSVRFSWDLPAGWAESFGLYVTVAFPDESIDVVVRPDGGGGTILDVRQRTFFCVLYVIPIVLSDDRVERRTADDVLEHARTARPPQER